MESKQEAPRKKMMGRMKREKIILFQRRLNNLKHKFNIGIAA